MSDTRLPAASGATAWRLLAGAVKGANKRYSQDWYAALQAAEGRAVVLAVADGHGSAAHFRSDLGARWAVEAFTGCAAEFAHRAAPADGGWDESRWPALLSAARSLPQQVVAAWRERAQLFESNSPSSGSLPGAAQPADLAAYGSTLVGAVLTARLLVCWQLGDGDIVLVDGSGRSETPLSTGPDLGDETESLCQPEAWRRMRLHWQPLTAPGAVRAVLLSTDGLSKSFADDAGFTAFARGVRQRAAERGLDAVQDQLGDWLGRAAAHSGDDTTLVGAFAPDDVTGTPSAGTPSAGVLPAGAPFAATPGAAAPGEPGRTATHTDPEQDGKGPTR